jgi:hypothetical protein
MIAERLSAIILEPVADFPRVFGTRLESRVD